MKSILYKSIIYKSGILIIPQNTKILTISRDSTVHYAGVITEMHGWIRPHLVLCPKPIKDLSDLQEECVMRKCSYRFPAIEKCRSLEVKPILRNGQILNADEWLTSPHCGIFALPAVVDEKDLIEGFGIFVSKTSQEYKYHKEVPLYGRDENIREFCKSTG